MSYRDRRLDMARKLTDAAAPGTGLRERLDAAEVMLHVDPGEGAATVLAAAAVVSMTTRVVGHVMVPPIPLPQPNPWNARTLADVRSASRIERPTGTTTATTRIAVGVGARSTDADLYLGGDDWTAVVSRVGPVQVGRCSLGGLGLQAAAALAFGEVLKDLLGPVGMRCVKVDGKLVWNILDGRLTEAPDCRFDRPAMPPEIALLGAGSVGSSTAAVLSTTPVVGMAEVVDPDSFQPRRNAYRCPGVPAAECGPKAAWSASTLRRAGWATRGHQCTIAEWAEARPHPGYPGIALVSVDNVDGRREAGDLLAATTITSGISGAALHVQRHVADDDLACPYCEFVDPRFGRDQVASYARLTGLTARRVEELLGGATLTVEDVATAIWSGCVEPRAADDLRGGRLVDLVARHYAVVAVEPSDGPVAEQVSAPHVAWLAGTLVAAEVTKAGVGLPRLDRRVELDLTGVPRGGWRRPPRDPSGRCPCTSPGRRELVRDLYAT